MQQISSIEKFRVISTPSAVKMIPTYPEQRMIYGLHRKLKEEYNGIIATLNF